MEDEEGWRERGALSHAGCGYHRLFKGVVIEAELSVSALETMLRPCGQPVRETKPLERVDQPAIINCVECALIVKLNQ